MDNYNYTIGKKIRFARNQREITQKELGSRCGIDEANIRKYELEKQKPRLDTLEKIASALEIDPSYFGTFNKTTDITFFDKTKSFDERIAAFPDMMIDVLEKDVEWVEEALRWVKRRAAMLEIDTHLAVNEISSNWTDEDFEDNYYHIIQELIHCFELLNTDGKRKLFSRLSELLETPKYTKKEE